MSGRFGLISFAIFLLASMPSPGDAQDQTNPEKWLKEAEDAYRGVTSYTAVFHKQQRVARELLKEETILIKCEVYDWDDRLVESYGYKHLELNANLTDADFDPDNSEYRF